MALSEYNQSSFDGGMNLLLNDTHLTSKHYRIGFNSRNRYDRLDLVLSSVEDVQVPYGKKQGSATLGNYELLFVAGKAYYKEYKHSKWKTVSGFSMSTGAPRYWTAEIPVTQTNFVRIAGTAQVGAETLADSRATIQVNNVAGASEGNLAGVLVQDNQNQPQFIYLNNQGIPVARTTQGLSQWRITFTDADNVTVATNGDQREYVPIGNSMAEVDGILYIVSQDTDLIYRSVSGRPLDFVVAITNKLADSTTVPPFTQFAGADARATAYSVGVGGITCIKGMDDGSLFVSAKNSSFLVSKNMTENSPKIFGEYTFIRKFLFNSSALSDRAIISSKGDTRFIDLTGVRSFNAIQQAQGSEGKNSVFTSVIRPAFGPEESIVLQSAETSAAILWNDYEFYALNTIFGNVIAVYDTIKDCWTSFDIAQTAGVAIKQFFKIELDSFALFAITEDDKVYELYKGPNSDSGLVRSVAACAGVTYSEQETKVSTPTKEVKLKTARIILDNIRETCQCSLTVYVNNRKSAVPVQTKTIVFKASPNPTTNVLSLQDVDSMLSNVLFSIPNCEQGWKVFVVLEWTSGSITQLNMELEEIMPMNPLLSQ